MILDIFIIIQYLLENANNVSETAITFNSIVSLILNCIQYRSLKAFLFVIKLLQT